jgi:hypothetical protein
MDYGAGYDPRSVFGADLDSDGDTDLAVANHGGDVSILFNDGKGVFPFAGMKYATGDGSQSVFGADLDSDGDTDLAVANEGSYDVSILLNSGNGTFAAAVNYRVGRNPCSVFGSDLDSDGDIDLAVANWLSQGISILLNSGNGTFDAAVTYGAEGSPACVFGADLDSDGDTDLAVANAWSDNVSILFNMTGPTSSDVGVASMDVPDTLPCGTTIAPEATVCNYGDTTETFQVVVRIDSAGSPIYWDSTSIAGLDSCTQVDFYPWTVSDTHGVCYDLTVWTVLPGDNSPLNDTLSKQVCTWCPLGVEEILAIAVAPPIYGLKRPRPNPTGDLTRIDYQLPTRCCVSLRVYDLKGAIVRTLVRGVEEAGLKTAAWDGRDDAGDQVVSGIYFYRLEAGDFTDIRKMVVLR